MTSIALIDIADDEGNDAEKVREAGEYDRTYSVCGTECSRLLKKPEIQDQLRPPIFSK
jgi:hypothetical protein